MDDKKKHGGRRPNQTGRPPKSPEAKKHRMGTLHLTAAALAALQQEAREGERWQDTINRVLEALSTAPR